MFMPPRGGLRTHVGDPTKAAQGLGTRTRVNLSAGVQLTLNSVLRNEVVREAEGHDMNMVDYAVFQRAVSRDSQDRA